jgi:Xaa-Pro aminopeptidase
MPDPFPARQQRLASALPLGDAVLIIGAGAPVPLPESTDQTYPFRAHSDYFYLTGLECPHAVVAYDPMDGIWHSYVPAVTEAERVWEGRNQPPGEMLADFNAWLGARRGRPIAQLGAPVPAVAADAALSQ